MKRKIIGCLLLSALISAPAFAEIEKQYTPAFGTLGNLAGNSVQIKGDVMAVEAWGQNVNGQNQVGMVSIYVRSGQNWIEEQQITPSDAETGDWFGDSFGLDKVQDTYRLIAGSQHHDSEAPGAGAAYIYRLGDGFDEFELEQKLTAPDAGVGDRFGLCSAISGDYAVVGAINDDDKGNNSGSAYIFEKEFFGAWKYKTKLYAPDGVAGDGFGCHVAINGNRVVVSTPAPGNSGPGRIYIFERNAVTQNWDFKKKLMAPIPEPLDYFGYSLDLQGDYILIGAPDVGQGVEHTGKAYLAKYTKYYDELPTDWYIIRPFWPADGQTGDHFGHGVAMSPTMDYISVGSPHNTNSKISDGAIYVFKKLSSADRWNFHTKLTANNPVIEATLGGDVDMQGCEIVGGAPTWKAVGSAYHFTDVGIPCN